MPKKKENGVFKTFRLPDELDDQLRQASLVETARIGRPVAVSTLIRQGIRMRIAQVEGVGPKRDCLVVPTISGSRCLMCDAESEGTTVTCPKDGETARRV